ncbi:hypothetical protein PC119_g26314 [Phytophthora cactorum]|nr:hypothetical protein PC114_g26627 [Phytophthora cactorum]KAG2960696.1 hypothetical protein PC119_g26314 [Phytophthora cactorum]
MFSYRCCTASLASTEKPDRYKVISRHPGLHKTFLLYWELHQQTPSHVSSSLEYCSRMINAMEINAANMLVLHFRRRLHQYVRFRYANEGKLQLSYKETKKNS